ncbi:SDR family NAD(P)-dependent oxidoreductase [Roseateles chitinivorans]|uniref:SDR family NAD(P)-dependent oxidoreductase n=1 Tax=Roseateles chitinivorans TaxID=2917965 RepID=UPI003D67050D
MTQETSSPQKALITGASSGIGATYADRLARRGMDLVLVARNATRLGTLADRLRAQTGVRIEVLPADLTLEADLSVVQRRLEEGDVTMLVNNAGMALKGGLLDASSDDLTRIIALNVLAPTRLAASAGKTFAARGQGAIVNLGSVLSLAPEMLDGVYSGTKAYVLNLSQSMTAQLKGRGVFVQVVLPGATRTEIWERSGNDVNALPPEMVMGVDELVDAALVGFDRGEDVTIPPLQDDAPFREMTSVRLAMMPLLSTNAAAPRYRGA